MTRTPHTRSTRTTSGIPLPYDCIALVLQGGGALGAYQGGVIEGLIEAGIEPDWLAGVSIGALNAAVFAGNPPERRLERLQEFWDTICHPAFAQPSARWLQTAVEQLGGPARTALNTLEAGRAVLEGQRGFFVPRLPPPWLSLAGDVDTLSWYDVSPLRATLERLVDFDRLNHGGTRVTVSAVDVASGNFELFDNQVGPWKGKLRAEHFMASGALPPGFPAIEIEGRHYWDGGMVSNTPLAQVLGEVPRRDTLAFQVDLWSARGPLPKNLFDIEERQKDIRFSSRTRAVTDALGRELHLRRLLREVLDRVPAAKRDDAWCQMAEAQACPRHFNVVHLIYTDKEWDGLSKDYEFSALTMRNHWASGLADLRNTLAQPDWLAPPHGHDTMVTHDVHRPAPAATPAPDRATGAEKPAPLAAKTPPRRPASRPPARGAGARRR